MGGRTDVHRLDLQEPHYTIQVADQIHLFGPQWPIAHFNSKATLPKPISQRHLHWLSFFMHLGSTGIHAPRVTDGCRWADLAGSHQRRKFASHPPADGG